MADTPDLSAPLRIGTRGSKLALWQAHHVRDRLRATWGEALEIELVIISTKGDQILDQPLYKIGGKGLFVNAIEEAMAAESIDLAVHSMKDLPGHLAPGMILACTPPREDPRDALLVRGDWPASQRTLATLPAGARVGTTSLRRGALCRRLQPGATILPLRGNVPTRISRLEAGDFDAILLAAAGLRRLELLTEDMELLDPELFCPAAGQGILALECREADARTRALVAPLNDAPTAARAAAERAYLARLDGGCQVPMGAYATLSGDDLAEAELEIRGIIGDPSGRPFYSARKRGPAAQAEALGRELAETLLSLGADRILERFTTHGAG
ncbi:MAG: hydroxymethylbilane synthase [Nannocystaceae bacterium]